MPIFSSSTSFFRRNKRKLIIASSVSFSIYLLFNHFIVKKLRNFQNSLRQELIFKEQIKRRFLQTQQDCYYTLLALLPVLTEPMGQLIPVELITQALKLKKSTQQNTEMSDSMLTTNNLNLHENDQNLDLGMYMDKSKNELWNLLKIKTLTRSLTLIYSASALLLLTRLQLNILARRSYLESAIVMSGGTLPNDINEEENYIVEQSYLSFSWWLLNKGWVQLSEMIENAVVKKFGRINARSELTVTQFNMLLEGVTNDLQVDQSVDLVGCLFPSNYDSIVETVLNTNPDLVGELDIHESNLAKLVNETDFLINSDVFKSLFNRMVSTGKDMLVDNITLYLNPSLLLSKEEKMSLVDEGKSFKLANFLAQLSVQNGIFMDNNNIPQTEEGHYSGNAYLNSMNDLEELNEFSASIYSNFD